MNYEQTIKFMNSRAIKSPDNWKKSFLTQAQAELGVE